MKKESVKKQIPKVYVCIKKPKTYAIGKANVKQLKQKGETINYICVDLNDCKSKIIKTLKLTQDNSIGLKLSCGIHEISTLTNEDECEKKHEEATSDSYLNKSVYLYSQEKNNSNLVMIVKNIKSFDETKNKSIYFRTSKILLPTIAEKMNYFIKFNSDKDTPSSNVISKLKKKSLLGDSFILFKDYYLASIMLATFYNKNKFIIKNIMDDTLSIIDNIQCRNLIMNTHMDNKKIIFFGAKTKVEKQLKIEQEKIKKEQERNQTEYNIYVDGSSNISRKMYSWSFVVYHHGKEIYFDKGHEEQEKYINHGSQIGEFLAMCNAMKYILENRLKEVTVWYDNVNNYNCMTALNTKNSTLYDVFQKYFEYTSKMRDIMVVQNLNVQYKHSKAHSGIVGNERADKLAKKAIYDVNSIF